MKSYKWHWIVLIVLIVLASVLGNTARADTSLRLGIMPASDHWDTSKPYNETHEGLFLEYRLSDNTWLGAMNYENSFYDTSNAYYYLTEQPLSDRWSWGYLIGGVTGYKDDRMMLYGAFNLTFHLGAGINARLVMIPLLVNGYQAYVEF